MTLSDQRFFSAITDFYSCPLFVLAGKWKASLHSMSHFVVPGKCSDTSVTIRCFLKFFLSLFPPSFWNVNNGRLLFRSNGCPLHFNPSRGALALYMANLVSGHVQSHWTALTMFFAAYQQAVEVLFKMAVQRRMIVPLHNGEVSEQKRVQVNAWREIIARWFFSRFLRRFTPIF